MSSPFLDLVSGRRSVRRFLDRPVEREKILACLEAARLAPSAENAQPWRFLVVDDPAIREKLSAKAFTGIYAMTKFAARAPVLILICCRVRIRTHWIGKQIQGVAFQLIDIGIAGEHIALQAQELGLGTCWIGWFNQRRTRKIFKIPRQYKIVCLMALGYAEPREDRGKKRKSLEEITWFNRIEN